MAFFFLEFSLHNVCPPEFFPLVLQDSKTEFSFVLANQLGAVQCQP